MTMLSGLAIENLHAVKGLDAVADAFSGTVTSDIVNMNRYDKVVFIVHKGVGATGTSTITVEACDDVSATNTSALAFHYRAITSGDTEGALTAATTAGFATTAGSSQLYLIEVSREALSAIGYGYVRLKAVEVVDSAVLGGILIAMFGPTFAGSTNQTAIT